MLEVFYAQINVVAIVVAAISSIILGMLWYGPLFGERWMKLIGYTKEEVEAAGNPMLYVMSLVSSLVIAFVMSHFVYYAATTWTLGSDAGTTISVYVVGLFVAIVAWLGFVATTGANEFIYGKKRKKLYLLDMGYQLTNFIIMGLILAYPLA